MNLYRVRWDGEDEFVEAQRFGDAVALWRAEMVRRWKLSGEYEAGHDDSIEPEEVHLVSECRVNPVIRAEQDIQIRFDGPPAHEAGRFVEVEDAEGKSVHVGEWVQDGTDWLLKIPGVRR